MIRRSLSIALLSLALPLSALGQMPMEQKPGQPMLSPPATATVTLGGAKITLDYHSPRMRGRVIMGALVPYDQVWRTGANDATTLVTPVPLRIGGLAVPAGTYTIYSLPAAGTWQLIVNKQTGQWGTEYHADRDLGRVPMTGKTLASPQEAMSISFENTKEKQTELHIRWEKMDEWVKVTTP